MFQTLYVLVIMIGKKRFLLVPQGGCWRNLPEDIAKEYLGGSYHLGGGKTGIARRMSWHEAGLTVLYSPAQNKQTDVILMSFVLLV